MLSNGFYGFPQSLQVKNSPLQWWSYIQTFSTHCTSFKSVLWCPEKSTWSRCRGNQAPTLHSQDRRAKPSATSLRSKFLSLVILGAKSLRGASTRRAFLNSLMWKVHPHTEQTTGTVLECLKVTPLLIKGARTAFIFLSLTGHLLKLFCRTCR